MKMLINMSVFDQDIDRYKDKEDLQAFYRSRGLDGLELQILWNQPLSEKIPAEDIVGIHLRMYPYWLDLWENNQERLLAEFGSEENIRCYYGGTTRDQILTRLAGELDMAEALGAQYVVFHAANVSFSETWHRQWHHDDQAVIDASCVLINELMDQKNYHFDFLIENLWWPGLRFTNPALTKRLMEGIHYPHKGIMLDVGHLLHTNLEIANEQEGIAYIQEMLDAHGTLSQYIKGIHLHQSITGDYVKKTLEKQPPLAEDFWERFTQLMHHVFQIDAHHPFTAEHLVDLLEQIAPEYLVLELLSSDRAEHGYKLDRQLEALRTQGIAERLHNN